MRRLEAGSHWPRLPNNDTTAEPDNASLYKRLGGGEILTQELLNAICKENQ